MNKQFYRTKFNAKLGTYVAVSELAKSHQGDTSPRVKSTIDPQNQCGGSEHITDETNTGQRTLRQLVLALSSLMVITPIYANVTVNKNAAVAHQATVLKAGNAANVWITAPSASGVSRNSYTQFDVNQNGVILNNSRGAATSQITKTSIAANPNLAKGAATTIVNEVVSSNPSLLQGNLEVLGSRANVVIANPTGITVNGGGFINANQVTLSTGALSYNSDGSIKQHTVKQGAITINPDVNKRGLGGNANNPIALELLGRSIAINAPVNANTITAVTGANTIAADTSEITTTTGSGTKPTVAIDVAQLGGLYANSIYLYANEAGVGVNNAGVIQVQNNVVLTSKGKIEHQGTISSTSKTQGLVSISTTGTGVAGDINSSGSINSYGILSIDAGNDINVKAKDITLNYGGATSSPLMLSANGNLNVAASTKVSNLGYLGDLYIDAKNITLESGSELRSNRGSAMIQANQNLISNKGGFVAAKDLSLFGNTNLKLKDTRLHASTGEINLQSSLKDSTTNTINVQGGTIYALKGLNVYSDQDITLNNINFLKKTDSTLAQINSLNVYAGNNLNFSTTSQELPYTSGKIQLGAGNALTLVGKDASSKLSGGGGLSLSGKSIQTKNIYMTGSGANGVDIVSNGGDIVLEQGSRFWGNTGDINVNAIGGSITANSLKAATGGKVSILASKDVNLNSTQNVRSIYSYETKTTDKTNINGSKGVIVGTTGDGLINIAATDLSAAQGEISLIGGSGVNLLPNIDVTVHNDDEGRDQVVTNVLNGQSISIENNKSNIQIANTRLTATAGELKINNKTGMTTLKDSVLTSKGNTELHAKDLLTLQGVTATSDQHLALNSGRTVYINAEYTPATKWIPNKTTNLTSKGVTSVTATGNQVLQNATITGGAVLIEAGGFILDNAGMNYRAIGSDLLKNDAKLNSLNGDLSIQTGSNLTIDPLKHKLSAVGDIDLTSKNGILTLKGYGGKAGIGSEKILTLETSNGNIHLDGQSVVIQGSTLKGKNIDITSTKNDLTIDSVKNELISSNSASNLEYLRLMKFVNDQQLATLNNPSSPSMMIMTSIYGQEGIRQFKNELENDGKQIADDTRFFSSNLNGYEHVGAKLIASGDVNLSSNRGVLVRGSHLESWGKMLIESKGTLEKALTSKDVADQIDAGILIDGHVDSYELGKEGDSNYSVKEYFRKPLILGTKGVDIKVNGANLTDNLVIQGAIISASEGNVNLDSTHDLSLLAGQDQTYDRKTNITRKRNFFGKKKTIETVIQKQNISSQPVEISANNINIKSKGDSVLYSTVMNANNGGNIDIHAKNLKLLVTDELNRKETTTRKKSSFWGLKYNDSKSNNSYKELSQLPVKAKADYINTRSDFDTLIQGSEFNYLKGATITAGGNIVITPATSRVEQSIHKEKNSVVWQSMQDKGSITETAQLPSFNGPVAPKFEAKGGLTVQVPVVSGKNNDVTAEIIKLSKQPGNEYLKSLIARKDVNWEAVKLAQENWDYKSQGLTGAGAAIIVLIVTVLTSGAGTAAATSVTSATGVASLGVGAQAAVTTLASQASVSLINNGGDITKTLKDLGSKDSVRNLATSVVTAGLLSQVGASLNLKPDSAYFPDRLMNNFTNTVGSTLVQTAINGGNLQDNLEKALLAGLSSSLQGELASQIGTTFGQLEPGTLEYVLHKIAHAAAGCATAAAADSSCGAGAIGAGVGEIVAALMIPEGKTALDLTEAERKSITDTSKIVAGTVSAFAGYDVITAANKAEIAVENNTLKPLSTAGKAVWKTAKAIKAELDAGKKLTANDIPGLLKDVVKGEIQNGGDSIKTILDPSATAAEKSLAILDLVIGVDLKAGKSVDVLKVDQKVIKKNINQSPKFQGASSATLNRIDNILSTSTNTTSGKGVLNYTQDASRTRLSDYKLLTVGGQIVKDTENFKMSVLQDGTKVIFRPSTTGPKTIEIQKSNGQKVMEIRYER